MAAIPLGVAALKPERLVIRDGRDWEVASLRFDDVEQLDQPLSGRLFERDAAGSARWLSELHDGSTIRAEVTYRGQNPAGSHFFGALAGGNVSAAARRGAFSGSIRMRHALNGGPIEVICEGPERVLPGQSATFVGRASIDVLVRGIVLDLAAEEWVIEDIRVGDRAQIVGAGVPGDLFAPGLFDSFVQLDPIPAGRDLSFRATYSGTNPRGRRFGATCLCRTREDLPSALR